MIMASQNRPLLASQSASYYVAMEVDTQETPATRSPIILVVAACFLGVVSVITTVRTLQRAPSIKFWTSLATTGRLAHTPHPAILTAPSQTKQYAGPTTAEAPGRATVANRADRKSTIANLQRVGDVPGHAPELMKMDTKNVAEMAPKRKRTTRKTKPQFDAADLVKARDMDKNMASAQVADIPRDTMSLLPLVRGETAEDNRGGVEANYANNHDMLMERAPLVRWKQRFDKLSELLGRHPTEQEWFLYSGVTSEEYLQMQRRSDMLRDKLVKANMGMVAWVSRQFLWSGLSLDELMVAGMDGLVTAIDKYDLKIAEGRDVVFGSYSRLWISAKIRMVVHPAQYITNIPKSNLPRLSMYEDALREMTPKLGRPPTREELAEELGLSVRVIQGLEHTRNLRSVSTTSYESAGGQGRSSNGGPGDEREQGGYAEWKGAHTGDILEDEVYGMHTKRALDRIFDSVLTDVEAEFVRMKFGLKDIPIPMEQSEIAVAKNLSRQYVSRVLLGAMKKLKDIPEIGDMAADLEVL